MIVGELVCFIKSQNTLYFDGIAYDKVLLGRIYLGVSDALNKI